jgi:hypothetical protein
MLAFAAEGDPVPRMDTAYARLVAFLYHRASADENGPPALGKIELPHLSLFRLGRIIILQDAAQDASVSDDDVDLRVSLLQEEDLSTRLWVNLFAHKMIQYAEWTARIAAGRFNGRVSWKSVSMSTLST